MKIFNFSKSKISAQDIEKSEFYRFFNKKNLIDKKIYQDVEKIIDQTKKFGDSFLIKASNKFDQSSFSSGDDFIVGKKEFDLAEKKLDLELKNALKNAQKRIENFHIKQMPKNQIYRDEQNVELGNLWRPIERIGVYTPSGLASYPSSVLMSSIPAIVAGVSNISMCVPSAKGAVNDAILYAAKICQIKEVYKIGGAQAIAAMTFGTNTIKKVNKIVGPGNNFVAIAKKILFGEVGIDMIAGPTDVAIICQSQVNGKPINSKFIAADALSQLEHGSDSKAIIITDCEKFASQIKNDIDALSTNLSRFSIIEKSIENSAIIIVKDINQSESLINFIAPEHLQIICEEPQELVEKINNAGAIFVGEYTPESIGDYIAGPSHTLPTMSSAKFSSGLSVYDFLKRISLISCDKKSFNKLAKDASIIAESEGLLAHKLSIDIRKS
jgi:histidinol dehydrogenase